jgi:hypothetical protein
MRDKSTARIEKRIAVEAADHAGKVCDSMAVRGALMERVRSGEITILQAQEELKRIKREGKRAGLPTRDQVWRSS